MKLKAPFFKVLVKIENKEIDKEEVSESGIILKIKTVSELEREKKEVCTGHIIALGPLAGKMKGYEGYLVAEECNTELMIGDRVIIHRYAGNLVDNEDDSEDIYRMVNDIDIIGIYK